MPVCFNHVRFRKLTFTPSWLYVPWIPVAQQVLWQCYVQFKVLHKAFVFVFLVLRLSVTLIESYRLVCMLRTLSGLGIEEGS